MTEWCLDNCPKDVSRDLGIISVPDNTLMSTQQLYPHLPSMLHKF